MSLNSQFLMLLSLICENISEFKHFDPKFIALSIGGSRGKSKNGIWAYVVPLRYVGGKPNRRGKFNSFPGFYTYECQHIHKDFPEAKYLMTVLVPRFFRLTKLERIETLVHELYHLHPTLRGDLRRFPSPHIYHGPTPKAFNTKVKALMDELLKNYPQIGLHPLFNQDEMYLKTVKRKRYDIPKRRFNFISGVKQMKLFGNLFFIFIFFMSLFISQEGFAQSKTKKIKYVYSLSRGKFYTQPSTKASIVDYFSANERYKFLKFSKGKNWVLVSQGDFQGWAVKKLFTPNRKTYIRRKSIEKRNVVKARRGELENFSDQDLFSYQATRSGRLYESADKLALRKGLVQKLEEISVLKKSINGQWVKIDVLSTGDKGWVPKSWVSKLRNSNLRHAGKLSFEGSGGYGTAGHNLGYGGTLTYALTRIDPKLEFQPRFELGVGYHLWTGEVINAGTSSLESSYQVLQTFLRYGNMANNGRRLVTVEVGASFRLANFLTTNAAIFDVEYEQAQYQNVGALVGVRAWYFLSSSFGFHLGVRSHISKNSAVFGLAGLTIRLF